MTTSIFGSVVHRVEDPRFLSGAARFVDDVVADGALRAVFVRSMMPHARLVGIDPSRALALPGVAAVLTGADLGLKPQPPSGEVLGPFDRPLLAQETVRFVGDPVALVLAEDAATAQDAAELVQVELEPLDPVVDPEASLLPGAALLFPQAGTNVAATFEEAWDQDVIEGADVVARVRVRHQRVAPVPMEPNTVFAVPGRSSDEPSLTLWVSTQIPFDVRNDVAEWLGLQREEVRVIAPDVGGGFGAKLTVYPEYVLLAAAAMRLERPVAWQESRSESMVAMTHGRAQIHDIEIGARRDGKIVGLRVDILADQGAYPIAAYLSPTTRTMLPGVYAIPRVASRGRSVVTCTTPVAPYRGAGRPEAALSIERAVDVLAAELEMDAVELRRRNLIQPDAFPYVTAVGETYDVGEYEHALDEALRLADVERLRREQVERRRRGDIRVLGVGTSVYVEVTGFSRKELGSVEITPDGGAVVRVGTSSHGQGHETAFAQLASSVLLIPVEQVRVLHSDTGEVARGEGTFGSRSLQIAGSSVFEAAGEVLEQARRLAAHLLEAAPEDVTLLSRGRIGVSGAPEASMSWAELAAAASEPPEGFERGLAFQSRRYQKEYTYPFGAHVAVVEVDLETGDVRPVLHVAVDDCGRVLNPMLVEGQVHGGLGQGIAQALFEEVVYDGYGTPLSANLATYQMPAASELPAFLTMRTETPTPVNPIGAKGIGESATIGSTPAVVNATVDALAHLGIRHLDLPLTPERVWRAISEART